MDISVVVPLYNEEESIPELVAWIKRVMANNNLQYDIWFVDDGSTDKTWKVLDQLHSEDPIHVKAIKFRRNYGKSAALNTAFHSCQGSVVITMDADLQDPPELIPEMIAYWEEGYDDVYARRNSREGETWVKKRTSSWYYKLLQSSTNIPIQIDTGDFRLLDRRCIDALKQFRESQRNTKAMFSWIGYRKKEIFYNRDPRIAGTTKWNYRKLVNLAIDGITSFTTAPLRIATISGLGISLLAFCYILYLVIRPLFGVPTGAGYSSLMAVILFIGGIQMLFLGIIGEYIGRIFVEVKQRPLYLIEEYHEGTAKKTRH